MEIRDITYLSIVLRILTAFVLGGIIGLERGMKNRPAGLRTYMLVCVGSCLIMLTNQYIYQVFGTGDPGRMGAQVVSGIGFLGAGTIVVTRRNQIRGLTTAAGLWASAAIGLAIGIGFYEAAIVGGVLIFVILTGMHKWDNRLHNKSRAAEIYVELDKTISLGEFIQAIRELDAEISGIQLENDSVEEKDCRGFIATVKFRNKHDHHDFFADIRSIKGVAYLEEL